MREELDFRVEARNMTAMAANWPAQQRAVGGSVPVTLPALYDQLSSEHVLVIEWLDGVSLRKAGPLIDDRGLDRAKLTRALMRSMVYQLTEGGVFHADPHPGNIMLLADDRLALLDFGSVGRLYAQLRSGLQNLLLAIGRGDPAALRDALLDLVTYPDELDEQQLERALGQFMAIHLGGGTAPSTEMFTDLFRLGFRFELTIPARSAPCCAPWPPWKARSRWLEPGFDLAGGGSPVRRRPRYRAAFAASRAEDGDRGADGAASGAAPAAAPGRPHHRRAWNKASSASTCGYSPMSATAGWSPT